MKKDNEWYIIIMIACASIVIFLVGILCSQTSENNKVKNLKTDIKRKLYTLDVDYRDEYVDLWYDIMNSPDSNIIVYSTPFIEPDTKNSDLLEYKKNAQNILNITDKLIEIYGSEFTTIFPQNPLYTPYNDENGKLIFVNTSTLNNIKQKCELVIKNIDKILDNREKEKQEKEELEKIVYGKD